MTSEQVPVNVGTAVINGKSYRIIRGQGEQAFSQDTNDEPPYRDGLPNMLSEAHSTWHFGGFKSRSSVQGTTEYGVDTDARWFRRLLPGPKINTISIPGNATEPTSIFEALDHIWVVCGQKVYRVDPVTLAVTESKDFGAGVLGVMGLKWEDDYGIVATDEDDSSLYKVSAIGTPDTWEQPVSATYTLRATGPGTTNNFSVNPGDGIVWDKIDDVVADDFTTYIFTPTIGSYVAQLQGDFSALPASGRITRIRTTVRYYHGAGGSASNDQVYLYLYNAAGNATYSIFQKIIPGNQNVNMTTYTQDSTVNPVTGVPWRLEDFVTVHSPASGNKFYFGSASGAGIHYITQMFVEIFTEGVEAYFLTTGINRLFAISKTGVLRNISTGLDPLINMNYADEIQIGRKDDRPTGMAAYERTVLVGKPDGVYGVGEEGYGVPLLKRIALHPDNLKGMVTFEPYVLLPHSRGLYRFMPGFAEAAGLELEIANDTIIKGPFSCFAPDGDWLWGFVPVGTDTYIVIGHEKRGNEPGFGPMIWDTLSKVAGNTRTAYVSGTTTPHRMYFGLGDDLAYIDIADINSSDYRYALSGSRFLSKMGFNDWNPKDFPKVLAFGKNLNADKYWVVNYSIDGGAFSDLDVDGNQMRMNTNGLHSFILPVSAVGAEIQYRLDYSSNSATLPPELNYFEGFAVPQSKKLPQLVFSLQLEEGLRHDNEIETRSSLQQLEDLQELAESASAVLTYGPWGEAVPAWVRKVRITNTFQSGTFSPAFTVAVTLQERER